MNIKIFLTAILAVISTSSIFAAIPSANNPAHSNPTADLPVLWRDNGPVIYEYQITKEGGDYGTFSTISKLDFWSDTTVKGQNIACRDFTNTTYANGRIYESEYIYYGHKENNTIVFTHRYDSYADGYESAPKIEKLADPVILKPTADPQRLIFNGYEYTRTF